MYLRNGKGNGSQILADIPFQHSEQTHLFPARRSGQPFPPLHAHGPFLLFFRTGRRGTERDGRRG